MKKCGILVLTLTLCLCLAACDLPFELSLGNQNDNALYAMLECEDYEAALKCVADAAQNPAENEITNTESLMAEYPELASLINNRDYDGAFCHVLSLYHQSGYAMEKWSGDICQQASEIVFTTWYTMPIKDEVPVEVMFKKDGTCSVEGDTYYWFMTGAAGTKDCMLPVFELHDGIQAKYRVDFNYADYADIYCMYLQDIPQSFYSMFVSRKEQMIYAEGTWLTPDKHSDHVEKVEIADNQVMLDGVAYMVNDCRFETGSSDDWAGTYVYYHMLDENGEYYGDFSIRNAGGSLFASLLLAENGQTTTYYLQGPDYDQAVKIYDYERALDVLSYLKGCDNGLDYFGDERTYSEWLDYIYNAMVAVNGYGESEKILSNFTTLEGLLTRVESSAGGTLKEYKYDFNGRLIYANDSDLTLYYYGALEIQYKTQNEMFPYSLAAHHYYYEYDADGRISKITHKDFNTLISTITPSYNDEGNITAMAIVYADGTTASARYVYDNDIMMPFVITEDEEYWEEEEPNVDYNVLREITYGEYWLNFAWTPDFDGYQFSGTIGWIRYFDTDVSYSDEYIYDDNGVLITKKVTVDNTTKVHTYTYDEKGRIISEQVTITYGEGNTQTVTYTYIYEDILFYNFDAE